jgi:hypothetical protein
MTSRNTSPPETCPRQDAPIGVDRQTLATITDAARPGPTAIEGFCAILSDIVRGLPYGAVKDDLIASRLIPLTIVNAGVRPIAIGEVFTRAAVGTLTTKHRDRLMAQLHASQVGKYLGGSEAAIHTARATLYENPEHIFIKVDISNAFNTVARHAVFEAVREHEPFLLPVVAFMYDGDASLTLADGFDVWLTAVGDPALLSSETDFALAVEKHTRDTTIQGVIARAGQPIV